MFSKIVLGLVLLFTINAVAQEKMDKLVLSGPMASVSHPLIHMIETGALKDVAQKIEFRMWNNPDELRALTLKGGADFIAIPTNVAANLYNKGVDIKLVNVSVWGILNILTRDKTLKTLADFKGKEIAMPFRADMPGIVFEEIIKKQGMDLKKDFKLKYLGSPIDAMEMLIMRRVDHALLAEPATSMALRKTQSYPLKLVSPDLYRGPDLQKEWGKTFNVADRIPEAGVSVIGDAINNKYLIKRFNEEYAKSLAWYKANPVKAGKMVARYISMLDADSINYVTLDMVDAKDSRKDLEFFFGILKSNNPKSIGNKIPDSGFYY